MSQIHVIIGTDEGTVSEQALKAFNQLKPEGGDDFSTEIINGVSTNADEALTACSNTIQALQTLPFFGGGKTVWLKNVNFLGADRTSKAEATKAGTEALLTCLQQGLAEDVCFVISCNSFNKSRLLCKFLQQNAKLQTYDKPDISRDGWQEQVAQVVTKQARPKGLSFDREALEVFVMLAGEDTRLIKAELEKLDIYLGDRRDVQVEDVRTIVPMSRNGVVFEIGNALQKKNGARALALIDQQMARKESAVGILRASIIPTIRNLFMAAAVSQGRKLPNSNYNQYAAAINAMPEQERAWLPQKKAGGVNAYSLFLASKSASQFGIDQLRQAMSSCLEADHCLVSTGLDDRMVLHRLVVSICTA